MSSVAGPEQFCSQLPTLLRLACGKQPVVADLDETLRQYVSHEAAQKFDGLECSGVAITGTKCHATLIDGHQAAVRDRDAMRVLPEIPNHLLGAAEGALAVYDPLEPMQLSHQPSEYGRPKPGAAVGASKLATRGGLVDGCGSFRAKVLCGGRSPSRIT